MFENYLSMLDLKKEKNTDKTRIINTIFWGWIIRIFCLFLVLYFFSKWMNPYFIFDDIEYENFAESYLNTAKKLIDKEAFASSGGNKYIQPFWPWVEAIFAFIFKTPYAGRLANIAMSLIIIYIIYKIVLELTSSEEKAITGAKLFAYLPVFILISCFPVKDFYIMMASLYCFYILAKYTKEKKINIFEWVLNLVLLVGIYYARGAVAEMLILFLLFAFVLKIIKKKHYIIFGGLCLIAIVCCVLFRDKIFGAFIAKINDYYSGQVSNGSAISLVKITSIKDIYKLPFAYIYATIQPFSFRLFSYSSSGPWLQIISFLNVSIIPIAIGNFLYIFEKKKNVVFWLCSTTMFLSVIFLSIGVFRHYFFLFPIEIINYCCLTTKKVKGLDVLSFIATICFTIIVVFISILRV